MGFRLDTMRTFTHATRKINQPKPQPAVVPSTGVWGGATRPQLSRERSTAVLAITSAGAHLLCLLKLCRRKRAAADTKNGHYFFTNKGNRGRQQNDREKQLTTLHHARKGSGGVYQFTHFDYITNCVLTQGRRHDGR